MSALAPVAKGVALALCLVLVGAFLGLIVSRSDYNLQGYVVVALAVALLGLFVLVPKAASGEAPWFARLLVLALAVKAGAALFRLYWGFEVKEGIADAAGYHGAGRVMANSIRHLDFSQVPLYLQPGTEFVKLFTGFVYAAIGPTLLGGYLFFAAMAFAGCVLYYKAFRVAFPEGDRGLYALLVFLYPSWVYWPSSIGKDAALALMIAMVAYGAAVVFRHNRLHGWVLLALGLAGATMVRPHVAALLGVALACGLVLGPPRRPRSSLALVRGLYIAIAVAGAWLVITKATTFLDFETVSIEETLATYEDLRGRASRGGAAFTPPSLTDPLGVPMAVATILFRPFPWEAHNLAALVLSLEGGLLGALMLFRIRSITSALGRMLSDPLVLFVVVYVVMFTLAFTVVGNFSILGRQRLQMLPLLFILLAHPVASVAQVVRARPAARGRGSRPSAATAASSQR